MDLNYIFKNDKVRVLGDHNRPLIPVVDVATEVGDQNYRRYVSDSACPGDTEMITAEVGGRKREVHVFTQKGLYRYLMKSNFPRSLEFQEYVLEHLCNR